MPHTVHNDELLIMGVEIINIATVDRTNVMRCDRYVEMYLET